MPPGDLSSIEGSRTALYPIRTGARDESENRRQAKTADDPRKTGTNVLSFALAHDGHADRLTLILQVSFWLSNTQDPADV